MPHLPPTRRGFVRQLLFGQAPAVQDAGKHTLVVVFLRGGADTLNMVVPYADDLYYKGRPSLAIPRPDRGDLADRSLRLDDTFSLHPKMLPLVPIWDAGRLGIVHGVGSDNPTGSHFEAQDQIEHGETYGRALGGGWLGRYLRARSGERAPGPLSAVAIGEVIPESLRGAPTAAVLRSIDQLQLSLPMPDRVTAALSAIYGTEVGLLGDQGKQTLALLERVRTLQSTAYLPEAGTVYPDDDFAKGLREIARLIKADVGLEAACIDLNGWDTHFFQGTTNGLLGGLVQSLSAGLAAFDADLAGVRERVTTVVMTEFGRRLYENGSVGTDHGRGFAMLLFGAGVRGGMHGDWPGLEHEASFPGPGGLETRVDYRSVLTETLVAIAPGTPAKVVFPGFDARSVGVMGELRKTVALEQRRKASGVGTRGAGLG